MQLSVVALSGCTVLEEVHVLPSSTVRDLQDLVAEAGGGPVGSQRLVLRGAVLSPHASLRKAQVRDGDVITLVVNAVSVDYRVMQGIVFKKPGDDPQRSKIVRLRRKVGTRIATTGRTWMGPQGGEWVEADQTLESPGWFLIRGPGFGFYGPLLEPASGGGEAQPQGKEEQPIVLYARHPLEYEHRLQLCLRPSQTIRDAKRWLARRVPGLRVQKIEVVRQRINCIDQARIQDEVPLRDAELADGDELDYIYLGDVDKDVWFPAER